MTAPMDVPGDPRRGCENGAIMDGTVGSEEDEDEGRKKDTLQTQGLGEPLAAPSSASSSFLLLLHILLLHLHLLLLFLLFLLLLLRILSCLLTFLILSPS